MKMGPGTMANSADSEDFDVLPNEADTKAPSLRVLKMVNSDSVRRKKTSIRS